MQGHRQLHKWVAKYDGNLVVTDKALKMLGRGMGLIPITLPGIDDAEASRPSVQKVGLYAGYVNFPVRKR